MPVKLPHNELRFEFSRSGGKGGQNVNKVESKVQLFWNPFDSSILTSNQKERLGKKLANHINWRGEIMVVASSERSQEQNREVAVQKLQALVKRGLSVPKKRTPTKPTKASKERRLESKTRRSMIKYTRSKIHF